MKLGCHAVVIVGFSESHWQIKNSWGRLWAGNGYFRIERCANLHRKLHPIRFFDVFWYESNLTNNERKEYQSMNEQERKEFHANRRRQKSEM